MSGTGNKGENPLEEHAQVSREPARGQKQLRWRHTDWSVENERWEWRKKKGNHVLGLTFSGRTFTEKTEAHLP